MYMLRLADGTTYRRLGQMFDMSRAYCARIAARVSQAIQFVFQNEVIWPTRAQALRSRDLFQSRMGLAGCVAAADGTEIRLRPCVATRQAEYSHKQYHSFKLHAVVFNEYVSKAGVCLCAAVCVCVCVPVHACVCVCHSVHACVCAVSRSWTLILDSQDRVVTARCGSRLSLRKRCQAPSLLTNGERSFPPIVSSWGMARTS